MIPTMKVVEIKPAQFIAASLPASEESANPGLGMSARGAGFSDSDDDWED